MDVILQNGERIQSDFNTPRAVLPQGPIELSDLTTPVNDSSADSEIWVCDVCVPSARLGEENVGGIAGYVRTDEGNSFNPEAVGVFLANNEHIGYLSEDELHYFKKWSKGKKLPFVGYVYMDKARVAVKIWVIIAKDREQLLICAAEALKGRRKEQCPNVVDLPSLNSLKKKSGVTICDLASVRAKEIEEKQAEYKPRPTATKKRIAEFRATAPELTDEALNEIIEGFFPDFFIPNNEVALEVVKETYREELPLTEDNFTVQLKKLTEGRKLLKWHRDLQYIYSPEAKVLQETEGKLIEHIYTEASKVSCKLSDFPEATKEMLDYLTGPASNGRTLEHSLNNKICNYYCRLNGYVSCGFDGAGYPPFRPFECDGEIYFVHHSEDKDAAILRLQGKKEPKEQHPVLPPAPDQAKGSGCMLWFAAPLVGVATYLFCF